MALAAPDTGSYALRADADSNKTIGSVKLELSVTKSVTKTENLAPYSLNEDADVDGQRQLNREPLPAGSYTVRATAYALRAGGGDKLGTLQVSLTVTAQ